MGARTVAPCMFCGEAPCACNGSAKRKSKPPTASGQAPVVQQPSPLDGVQFDTVIKQKSNAPSAEKRDEVMSYAVEVMILSGMVHSSEVPRLKRMFYPVRPTELIIKTKDWLSRNGRR